MTDGPVDLQKEIPRVTNSIQTRRSLRLWAADKPEHVRNLVHVICGQMRALQLAPDSQAVRRVLRQNLERLALT